MCFLATQKLIKAQNLTTLIQKTAMFSRFLVLSAAFLLQGVAATRPDPSALCPLRIGYREEKDTVVFRPDRSPTDSTPDSPLYDCTQLSYSYDINLKWKLDLSQLDPTTYNGMRVTALNRWSTLGKTFDLADFPIYILQAGDNKLSYNEVNLAASMDDVYTTAENRCGGITFFMMIRGLDVIKTHGGASSTINLRADEITLRLNSNGVEWVQTTGGNSMIYIPDHGPNDIKRIIVSKWDTTGAGVTQVRGFDPAIDEVLCQGFDSKVDACACFFAFDDVVTDSYRNGNRWAHTSVPILKNGNYECREMEIKGASGTDLSSNIAKVHQSGGSAYDCTTLTTPEKTSVNTAVSACNGVEPIMMGGY